MYKKSILKNGIRAISVLSKATKTITVLVLVNTGSKNENKRNMGISHFLEHMFFKGTKKRPTHLDISKEIDKIGGIYNAFTGKENTGFWVKVDNKHLDLALDVVSDILLNSKFPASEIKKERGTIMEEFNMYMDNPTMRIDSLFESLLYQNQSMGYEELGSKETINSMNREKLIRYYKNYYTSENIVAAVAGNFDEKEIFIKMQRYFGKFENRKSKKQSKAYDKQNCPMIVIERKKTDQTHFCLGARGYNINQNEKYAVDVLSVILGGNCSSRIFTRLREKEGLAYYVYTFSENYKDVGYIATKAGVNNNEFQRVIEIILEEYKRTVEEKISEEEINMAKDYIKGRLLISLESSDAVCSFIASQEINGKEVLTLKEKFDRIDAVKERDLKKAAKYIFSDNKLNLAAIGPFSGKRKFEKKLRFGY